MNKNFNPFPALATERLLLRRVTIEDTNEIFALRSNESVNQFLDRAKANSLEDAIQFINKINISINENEIIYWAIIFKPYDIVLGTIGMWSISEKNCSAEIGYELLPSHQAKGIMQEAISAVIHYGFEVIGLEAINAYLDENNQRSVKLLEKNNFKRNPTNRNFTETEAAGFNIVTYTLTKYK